MSDVTVIGLGAMGSELARALLKAGYDVTAWNRSREKIAALEANGAKGAASISEAVEASPQVIVSIDNYAATQALLRTDDVVPHLSGRTVIQLSTGTPSRNYS